MAIRVERNTDGGRGYRWQARCDAHGYRALCDTKVAAQDEATRPGGWCPACRAVVGYRLPEGIRAYLVRTRGEAAVATIERPA